MIFPISYDFKRLLHLQMTKKDSSAVTLKAATLLAQGLTESEVAASCGRSRSWVQSIKRSPDFQQLVEESRVKLGEVIQASAEKYEVTKIEEHHQKIENFRQRSEHLGCRFLDIVEKMLNLYEIKLQQAQAEDLSLNRLPSDIKSLGAASEMGRTLLAQALGIRELMQVLSQQEENENNL